MGDSKRNAGIIQKYRLEMALAAAGIIAVSLLPTTFFVAVGMDDGFMYFTLARSAAAGHFLSADYGNSLTNGFQVLWYAILGAVFWTAGKLGADGMACARIAYSLSWAMLVLSSLLAKRLIEATRLHNHSHAAQLLMVFNPLFIATAFNGIESTLYGTLILLAFYFVVYKKGNAGLALISALCVLARLDAVLFLAPIMLLCDRRQKKAVLLGALIAYAAYIGTNYAIFGQVTPYPQQLKGQHMRAGIEFFTNGAKTIARSARDAVFFPKVLAILVFATIAGALAGRKKLSFEGDEARMAAVLAISAVLYLSYYSFIVFPSPWHLYPMMMLIWLATVPLGLHLANSLQNGKKALVLALLACELAAGAGFLLVFPSHFNGTFHANAVEFSQTFPNMSVCAYNFGIISFFATNDTAINLDGLMNNDAALRIIKNDSSDILYAQQKCDFILDTESSAQRRFLWRGGTGQVVVNTTLSPTKCILEYCREVPTDHFIWIAVSKRAIQEAAGKSPGSWQGNARQTFSNQPVGRPTRAAAILCRTL